MNIISGCFIRAFLKYYSCRPRSKIVLVYGAAFFFFFFLVSTLESALISRSQLQAWSTIIELRKYESRLLIKRNYNLTLVGLACKGQCMVVTRSMT